MKENFNFLKTIYFFYSLEMSKQTLKRTQSTTKIAPSTDEPTSRKEPKAEQSNFLLLSSLTKEEQSKLRSRKQNKVNFYLLINDRGS